MGNSYLHAKKHDEALKRITVIKLLVVDLRFLKGLRIAKFIFLAPAQTKRMQPILSTV